MTTEQSKWLVLEDDGWQVVIPETDILPHGYPDGKLKTELAGQNCPCKPKINWQDKMIVHNSFKDKQKVEESIKSNFL